MRVEAATRNDLGDVRAAYAAAREIQRQQGGIQWPPFPDASILAEVDRGHLLRVMNGAVMGGVFSIAHRDDPIWGEYERGEHLYLHRIARAAGYPGRGLLDTVLAWSRTHGRALGWVGLRMDTWASNHALVDLYRRYGFHVVAQRRIGIEPRLPTHYHGNEFTLLEVPL